ncbi:MAG: DUF4157 domain-containing protein [Myxococcota bacterium]
MMNGKLLRKLDTLKAGLERVETQGGDFEIDLPPAVVGRLAQDPGILNRFNSKVPSEVLAANALKLGLMGDPMPLPFKKDAEAKLGRPLDNVRCFGGQSAAEACAILGARAFAVGNIIIFGLEPTLEVVLHELAHVLQQKGDTQDLGSPPDALAMASAGDATETEAEQVASGQKGADAIESHGQSQINGFLYSDGEADEDIERFIPNDSVKTTKLTNAYGEFKVEHGLESAPDPDKTGKKKWGRYYMRATMTAKKKVGKGAYGFVQTVRSAKSGEDWSTEKGDPGIATRERAKRTDPDTGWRVDRGSAIKYKTPFYGMKKVSTAGGPVVQPKDKNNQFGSYGKRPAIMRDRPMITLSKKMEFITTAMAVSDGREFGAFQWGFDYDAKDKRYKETNVELISNGDPVIKERDDAMDIWNDDIATSSSGIDDIPGR